MKLLLPEFRELKVMRSSLPLLTPYRLSYGPLESLESVFVKMETLDGRVGWGESTVLPGYCDCTIDEIWQFTNDLVSSGSRNGAIEVDDGTEGFLYTALWSAAEMVDRNLDIASDVAVPLAALVQGNNIDEEIRSIKSSRALGYRIFKAKIGFYSTGEDKDRLELLQDALEQDERLRVDGNQGLDLESSSELLSVCRAEHIEFFEQPTPKTLDRELAEVSKDSPVPILLDEAICDLASMERYRELGFRGGIKLKWMKAGGWQQLQELTEFAAEQDWSVVLGNGVSSELGCFLEMLFWQEHLASGPHGGIAGEMNGFEKIAPEFQGACLEAKCGRVSIRESIDHFELKAECVERMETYRKE